MRKNLFLAVLAILAFSRAHLRAQTTDESNNWGIKFSGFVRHDVMYDTRQNESLREGELLFYPKDVKKDTNGSDINASPTFHMLAITSRLTGTITGPEAFGAKTSGIIEAEFFGNGDALINEFRLRHAWIKLDWEKTQLALGQYWHPMFVTDCYPGVTNFNTGAPFQPFNRSPQIRVTHKLSSQFTVIGALVSERDFSSTTVTGTGSTEPARNAAMPAINAHLQFKNDMLFIGLGAEYKSLRPRLATGGTKHVEENKVNAITTQGYIKITLSGVVIKMEDVYGQNMNNHLMVGGYLGYRADTSVYKPTHTRTSWLEISGRGKTVVPALFVGALKNDGAGSSGAVAGGGRGVGISGRGISEIIRIAPRCDFISGKVKFSLEYEMTRAKYGDLNSSGKAKGNYETVTNNRLLLATVYSF